MTTQEFKSYETQAIELHQSLKRTLYTASNVARTLADLMSEFDHDDAANEISEQSSTLRFFAQQHSVDASHIREYLDTNY